MIPMEYYHVCHAERERYLERFAREQAMLAQLDALRPGLLAHVRAWLDSLAGTRSDEAEETEELPQQETLLS